MNDEIVFLVKKKLLKHKDHGVIKYDSLYVVIEQITIPENINPQSATIKIELANDEDISNELKFNLDGTNPEFIKLSDINQKLTKSALEDYFSNKILHNNFRDFFGDTTDVAIFCSNQEETKKEITENKNSIDILQMQNEKNSEDNHDIIQYNKDNYDAVYLVDHDGHIASGPNNNTFDKNRCSILLETLAKIVQENKISKLYVGSLSARLHSQRYYNSAPHITNNMEKFTGALQKKLGSNCTVFYDKNQAFAFTELDIEKADPTIANGNDSETQKIVKTKLVENAKNKNKNAMIFIVSDDKLDYVNVGYTVLMNEKEKTCYGIWSKILNFNPNNSLPFLTISEKNKAILKTQLYNLHTIFLQKKTITPIILPASLLENIFSIRDKKIKNLQDQINHLSPVWNSNNIIKSKIFQLNEYVEYIIRKVMNSNSETLESITEKFIKTNPDIDENRNNIWWWRIFYVATFGIAYWLHETKTRQAIKSIMQQFSLFQKQSEHNNTSKNIPTKTKTQII